MKFTFSNKYILKVTFQIVAIFLIYAIYNIIRYGLDSFLIIQALYSAGILLIIIFMITFVVASLSKRISISIKSFGDIILWSLITTYYLWSLSILIYDNVLRSAFDKYWNVWNVVWILFAIWFFPLFGIFYLLYKKTKLQ